MVIAQVNTFKKGGWAKKIEKAFKQATKEKNICGLFKTNQINGQEETYFAITQGHWLIGINIELPNEDDIDFNKVYKFISIVKGGVLLTKEDKVCPNYEYVIPKQKEFQEEIVEGINSKKYSYITSQTFAEIIEKLEKGYCLHIPYFYLIWEVLTSITDRNINIYIPKKGDTPILFVTTDEKPHFALLMPIAID